jgi:hypothetical protein
MSNFMKVHPVGAELFIRTDRQTSKKKLTAELFMRTEGQTDKHYEANSRVSQFCEPAEKLHANFRAFQNLIAVEGFRALVLNDTSADLPAGRHSRNDDKNLKKIYIYIYISKLKTVKWHHFQAWDYILQPA